MAAVARVAEDWGADWRREGERGELRLPVVAGLRRGVVEGPVRVERDGEAVRISFEVTQSTFHVQRPAVVILCVALGAAAVGLLWPFFPGLLAAAPWAAAVVLSAWLLVVGRLRSAGPEEFLHAVAAEAATT